MFAKGSEEEAEHELPFRDKFEHAEPGTQTEVLDPRHSANLDPNSCPVCRAGRMTRKFTTCGIVLAVLLFPFGLICCCVSSVKKCDACGYTEGF
ncbi:DUF2367 domain containing protein [Asbolus verrucosus]|uniref:Membrane protein BRI3 n=1 Tax=Asbolus verrucosus TaxID=1661398 RepID=A0A482VTV9_ASBVE|nr:DUF2367 domain containing protein [Asbolus verrucosus]